REQISGAGHHGSENIAKKFLQAKGVPIRQCLAIAQGSSVKLSCCQRGCLTELLFAIRKHGVREFRSDLRKTLVDCVGDFMVQAYPIEQTVARILRHKENRGIPASREHRQGSAE